MRRRPDESTSGDGCSHTESDDSKEVVTQANDRDVRYVFLAVYTGLMAIMFVAATCVCWCSRTVVPYRMVATLPRVQ